MDKLEKYVSPSSWEALFVKLFESGVSIGLKLLAAVLVFIIGRWLIKKLKNGLDRIMQRRDIDPSLCTFLKSLVSIILNFTLVIILIGILGIQTSSFIALFASAGIAIGAALSGTLQNLAGGVMILLFKPFRVGDFIQAQGESGTVKEILIFNTILITSDNRTIILPNGSLSSGVIENNSTQDKRRIDWTFGFTDLKDFQGLRDKIAQLLESDNRILKEPKYVIALNPFVNNTVNVVVQAWVKSSDYYPVYYNINEKLYDIINEHAKQAS